MSPSASSDATRYARIRYALALLELAGWIGFLAAYQLSGWSWRSARWAATLSPDASVQLAAYLAVFGTCAYLIFLPLHFSGGFLVEHRFGLSRLRLGGWLMRELKQVVLSAALSLLLIEGWYVLLRSAPDQWVVWATVGWLAVSVVLARIFPTWLLPIFYRTAPLADEPLVKRLMSLCARARLSALGVFQVDLGVETRKANAALAGFGRTKRVLVSDTLLAQFAPDEIETVLAHELGHQRHHHLGKLLVLSGAGSWVAFALVDLIARAWLPRLGVQGLSDAAGFPALMLLLSVLGLIGLPLQNALSRHFEWQADRFAVALTQQPAAFAGALRKLGQLNLADPNPPAWAQWLFYDHPPITHRITAAERGK